MNLSPAALEILWVRLLELGFSYEEIAARIGERATKLRAALA